MNADQYLRQLVGDIVVQLAQALAERDAAAEAAQAALQAAPQPAVPTAPDASSGEAAAVAPRACFRSRTLTLAQDVAHWLQFVSAMN